MDSSVEILSSNIVVVLLLLLVLPRILLLILLVLIIDRDHVLLINSMAGQGHARHVLLIKGRLLRLLHERVLVALIFELLGEGVLDDAAHAFELALQVLQLVVAVVYRLLQVRTVLC